MIQVIYVQNRSRLADLENELTVTKGKGRGEGQIRDLGPTQDTLLYVNQVINKDLLYNTGNSAQHSVMTYEGKEARKEWMMYVYN